MISLKEFKCNYKLLYVFYKKYNPHKIDNIEDILNKYKLRDLDNKLLSKYGESPLKIKNNYCENCECQSCLKLKYKYQQKKDSNDKSLSNISTISNISNKTPP